METKDGLNKLLSQESFYICMNCREIYQENPQTCTDSEGIAHSSFVDMAKFLGRHPQVRSYGTYQSILRFDIGQAENLDSITDVGNIAFERILRDKGFVTLGRVDNSNEERRDTREKMEASWKKVTERALALATELNKRGEKYLVFSNSYMDGSLRYTFMRKNTP